MNKRLLTATCAIALGLWAASAEARSYHGHHGHHGHHRHYRHSESDASTSRGCLRASARALLNRIEARFGRVQIVSTCRPGARIAGTGHISKHASGEAIDFNAPRGKKGAVVSWLIANHKSGGTMTYSDMNHIHVDVGYHFVSLGANSHGGGGYHSRRGRAYASARRRSYASGSDYYPERRSGLGMSTRRHASERYSGESGGRFVPSAASNPERRP